MSLEWTCLNFHFGLALDVLGCLPLRQILWAIRSFGVVPVFRTTTTAAAFHNKMPQALHTKLQTLLQGSVSLNLDCLKHNLVNSLKSKKKFTSDTPAIQELILKPLYGIAPPSKHQHPPPLASCSH
jgi:hypothetical protein